MDISVKGFSRAFYSLRAESPQGNTIGIKRKLSLASLTQSADSDAVKVTLSNLKAENADIAKPFRSKKFASEQVKPVLSSVSDQAPPVLSTASANPPTGGIKPPKAGGDDKYIPGDANLDGFVDEKDFEILKKNLFSKGGREEGDFNGDGLVDGSDFSIWNENKFKYSNGNPIIPSTPSAVPTPAADTVPVKEETGTLTASQLVAQDVAEYVKKII